MVGVYPADFEARGALDAARRTIESVPRHTLARHDHANEPARTSSGRPPNRFGLNQYRACLSTAADWACDNAYVAAHNAAVGISTRGPVNGYDVSSLAQDALGRIEALAHMTA